MGLVMVDDLGKGYDTKEESMLRMRRTGGPNTPKFILTDEAARPGHEPREELARMLTAHPQFARATRESVLVEADGRRVRGTQDEFDLARQDPNSVPKGWDVQPSHPELLDKMAADFRQNNYSLHKLFAADLQFQRVSAFGAVPGRMEGQLHQVLCPEVRPHARRGGIARRDCRGHRTPRQLRRAAGQRPGAAGGKAVDGAVLRREHRPLKRRLRQPW